MFTNIESRETDARLQYWVIDKVAFAGAPLAAFAKLEDADAWASSQGRALEVRHVCRCGQPVGADAVQHLGVSYCGWDCKRRPHKRQDGFLPQAVGTFGVRDGA